MKEKKLFLLRLKSQSFVVSRRLKRSLKLASSNLISMRKIVQLTIGFLLHSSNDLREMESAVQKANAFCSFEWMRVDKDNFASPPSQFPDML